VKDQRGDLLREGVSAQKEKDLLSSSMAKESASWRRGRKGETRWSGTAQREKRGKRKRNSTKREIEKKKKKPALYSRTASSRVASLPGLSRKEKRGKKTRQKKKPTSTSRQGEQILSFKHLSERKARKSGEKEESQKKAMGQREKKKRDHPVGGMGSLALRLVGCWSPNQERWAL